MTPPDELTNPEDANVLGIGGLIALAPVIFSAAAAQQSGRLQILTQRSMEQWKPTLITPSEAAEMVRRGLLDDGAYERELGRLGYSTDRVQRMRGLTGALVGAGELVELLRRGNIGDDEFAARMSVLGYDERQRSMLASLRFYVPSVQDVIPWAVREVFTPEIRKRFGQDENFPDALLPYAQRAGVRDEDARNYWAAHWELPSPAQGFEMFQRAGETGVTLDDLKLLLRAHDVMPYWREAMIKIAYTPITRVDVRRLHKLGLLTFDEMVERYERVGYNPEDADKLARFTEKLNSGEQGGEASKVHAQLRQRAKALYEDSALSADDLRAVYVALDYSAEDADAFVAEAEFVRLADVRREQRAAIKVMYVRGVLDTAGAAARLGTLGYDEAMQRRIMEPWHLAREARELTVGEHAERDLTRADIVGAYADAILSRASAGEHLLALRYDADEAELILARADIAQSRAERASAETASKALYTNRRIDRAGAISSLGKAKIPQARITMLVAQWDDELEARAPSLTVAQITAALKAKLIDKVEAAARLDGHGYTVDDRNIILELAGGD